MSLVRLERLIQELNLFEVERRNMPMESVKELMRQRIGIEMHPLEPSNNAVTFSLAFGASDGRALRVVERLATLFMQESLPDPQDPSPELREHFQIVEAPRITDRPPLPSQLYEFAGWGALTGAVLGCAVAFSQHRRTQ